MLREKLYELQNWKGVVHTTWNPDGPGVIRIHMIPPKFTLFQTAPSVVILNGQEVLPVNESWAILLTEFIRGVNAHGPGAMTAEVLQGILSDAFHRVRRVYPGVADEVLARDLESIVDLFERVIRGEVEDEEVGLMSLAEYAPFMTAPHRMDLMVSAMTKAGAWHCNEKCVHCYAAGQPLSETEELSTEEWKRIIRACRAARIPQLTFTGGEPTLREDLPELIREARWFVTRLNTNGIRLTPELCRKLKEAELDSVQVTLYSDEEEIHNALVGGEHWRQTVEGIRNALETGLNLSVNTPLCSLNRRYAQMLAFLHELGVEYVTCSGLIVTGNATGDTSKAMQLQREEITESVRRAAEFAFSHNMEMSFTSPGWIPGDELLAMGLTAPGCGAGLGNMAITPDGHVVPCQSWLSDAPLGDMKKDAWKKIWESGACRRIREISTSSAEVCPLRGRAKEGEVTGLC